MLGLETAKLFFMTSSSIGNQAAVSAQLADSTSVGNTRTKCQGQFFRKRIYLNNIETVTVGRKPRVSVVTQTTASTHKPQLSISAALSIAVHSMLFICVLSARKTVDLKAKLHFRVHKMMERCIFKALTRVMRASTTSNLSVEPLLSQLSMPTKKLKFSTLNGSKTRQKSQPHQATKQF